MIAMVSERLSTGETMAKKKAAAPEVRFNPRTAGMQTLEIAAIREMIAKCRQEFADMDIVLSHAGTLELDAVEVDGATKLPRALDLLRQFAYNLEIGVTKTHRKNRRP